MRTPPNDIRHFVHKRLIKAATGFVTSGFNPLAAVGGFLAPTPRRAPPPIRVQPAVLRAPQRAFVEDFAAAPPRVRRPTSPFLTARPGATSAAEKAAGRRAKFRAEDVIERGRGFIDDLFGRQRKDCGFGKVWDEVRGKCVFGLGEQAGRDDTPIGDTVMGQYGAGELPGNMVVNRAICRPGMVLANDGVCYNRSQISNKQREWPRGRRPLLTGGDMRAISTAARAGKRLEGATKRLQKMGMMKKAGRSRPARLPPHQHQISSGG